MGNGEWLMVLGPSLIADPRGTRRRLSNVWVMNAYDADRAAMQVIHPQLKNLPDLPGLESVELRNWRGLAFGGLVLWMYLGLLALPIYGCIALWQYVDQRVMVVLGLLALLCLWLLMRFLSADLYWKTDSHGLTVNAILRRRFIAWTEVREARSRLSVVTKELTYVLRTDRGTVIVPSHEDGNRRAGRELAPSVRQHLKSVGKADDLALSKEALSLWDEIPDALPRQIEWRGRSRRWDAVGGAVMAAIFGVGLICIAFQGSGFALLALAMTPCVLFIGSIFYREAFLASESVTLNDDYIEAKTLKGKTSLCWPEVASARWEKWYLVLESSDRRKRVSIDCSRSGDDQRKLILGVIRRLRELRPPIAMAIPEDLRAKEPARGDAPPLPIETDRAELKPTAAERAAGGICSLILLGFFLMPLYNATQSTAAAVAGGIVIFASGTWAVGTYGYRADREGVEKRFLWWKRAARWAEVARYEQSRTAKHHYRKWLLRDSAGRKLIDVTLDTGPKKDKDNFEGYVRARIAEVSPPGTFDWMARRQHDER